MTTQTPIQNYLVVHIATTCDEHGVYVTKDSAEVIEIGWVLLDSKSLEEVRHLPAASAGKCTANHNVSQQLARDSVLVKPVNTPITPLCTSLTTIQWE